MPRNISYLAEEAMERDAEVLLAEFARARNVGPGRGEVCVVV